MQQQLLLAIRSTLRRDKMASIYLSLCTELLSDMAGKLGARSVRSYAGSLGYFKEELCPCNLRVENKPGGSLRLPWFATKGKAVCYAEGGGGSAKFQNKSVPPEQ